ncbi:hypothetical protein Tco_1069772 [Tanacetum coccineum]|uniref:Reverse transcriptase Ty1/copia-type domain-containing protein n=1 Tax=Tanacetum coccineum TaxID=301880 RepID=A0ABQ5HJH1_9ASTR
MSMMGELKFFLGLQVHQSPRSIFISQSQYAIKLLKKHSLDECVSMSTPMATERLNADLQGTPTDQTTYRHMIGGLMYLTASQPDITFATFVCARYQALSKSLVLNKPPSMLSKEENYVPNGHSSSSVCYETDQWIVGGNGGNQFRQYAGQNVGNQNGYNAVPNVGIRLFKMQLESGCSNIEDWVILLGTAQSDQGGRMLLIYSDSVVDCQKEEAGIQTPSGKTSTSGYSDDNAPVYDSSRISEVHKPMITALIMRYLNMFTQEEQYTELLEPFLNPIKNTECCNVISDFLSVEQEWGEQ